jgi:hypothetical protein
MRSESTVSSCQVNCTLSDCVWPLPFETDEVGLWSAVLVVLFGSGAVMSKTSIECPFLG